MSSIILSYTFPLKLATTTNQKDNALMKTLTSCFPVISFLSADKLIHFCDHETRSSSVKWKHYSHHSSEDYFSPRNAPTPDLLASSQRFPYPLAGFKG